MTGPAHRPPFAEALKVAQIRSFIGGVGFFTLASRALAVVIGFQIYRITHDPLSLGWLGLVEAIPAISMVPFGGYAADHFNRRQILLITRGASVLCALVLAWLSWEAGPSSLFGLYLVICLVGIARGFADPASSGLEAQVVPKVLTVNASSWISSTWLGCAVIGPAIIGFVFDFWGASVSYLVIASSFAISWVCTCAIGAQAHPVPEKYQSLFRSLGEGWRFVLARQELWGAMALDLFAVLFGGATALLPIFADDILHVGAKGLGLLNASTYLGAFVTMLFTTKHPPIGRAGRNLLVAVTGFGVSILIFAFSRNFWLSMAALFVSGMFDGISVVIRRSMLRLLSPDHLRGRIAATNLIFISASNELGAFESGVVASLIGTVPCVAAGGVVTFIVVAWAAAFWPKLRDLRFDTNTLEQSR